MFWKGFLVGFLVAFIPSGLIALMHWLFTKSFLNYCEEIKKTGEKHD